MAPETVMAETDMGLTIGRAPPSRSVEDDSMLVLEEIMRLVDASKEGRLSERGKATLFNGVHREMIQGVNEMLDAICCPSARATAFWRRSPSARSTS